jgi:23S rRNA (pseudouridine1915-N3)-methyltransferase
MKITLLLAGKTTEEYLNTGVSIYVKRIVHYLPFEIIELPAFKSKGKITPEQQKEAEADIILKHLNKSDRIVLLDEKGKTKSSTEFADFLNQQMNSGIKNLFFVVGGPFGFSERVYSKAHLMISLSKMTFSHQLVRLVFVEQLYRALTILKNEPYHHE